MNALSENIARFRKRAGMTQEELGRVLSVSTQAISRWERGGAPDVSMLPAIAEVFHVSLDTLFGNETKSDPPSNIEKLLTEELQRTPPEQRFERTYALAWHMMKETASSLAPNGETYFRLLTTTEGVDRRIGDTPEDIPSVSYVSHDTGLMHASVAKDFHYVLIMPEPEEGFSSIMKYCDEYRRFFAFLAKPNRLEMLTFMFERQHFTAALAAHHLGISCEEAESILNEMYMLRLVRDIVAETPKGMLHVYRRLEDTALIPFLYTATELMRAQNVFYTLHMREKPFFSGSLGARNPSPDWKTRKSPSDGPQLSAQTDGCVYLD
ncbi:MAG: helix-turn-helix domain-containing protein [Oscillospiraceae bacterium]